MGVSYVACRNHRRVEDLVGRILRRCHKLECHIAGLALYAQDLHYDEVLVVEGDDTSQLQLRVDCFIVDMDGLLPYGQLLLYNSDIFLVVVFGMQLSELLESRLFIFILALFGEVVVAILDIIIVVIAKFEFIIEIRIQLGYF